MESIFNEINDNAEKIKPLDEMLEFIKSEIGELYKIYKDNTIITESQIDDFTSKIEARLSNINIRISNNDEYVKVKEKILKMFIITNW